MICWSSFVMIALVVVKIYAVTLSIGFSRRFFPKKRFWGIKGGLLTLGTCPPKGVFTITFLTHVPNFRKIGQKIVVAIVDETFCGHTNTHTNTQTNTQVILYLSNAMNCIGQTTRVQNRESSQRIITSDGLLQERSTDRLRPPISVFLCLCHR